MKDYSRANVLKNMADRLSGYWTGVVGYGVFWMGVSPVLSPTHLPNAKIQRLSWIHSSFLWLPTPTYSCHIYLPRHSFSVQIPRASSKTLDGKSEHLIKEKLDLRHRSWLPQLSKEVKDEPYGRKPREDLTTLCLAWSQMRGSLGEN